MKDPQPRLNRTFVELKHKEEVKDALKQTGLNRTFVELKQLTALISDLLQMS